MSLSQSTVLKLYHSVIEDVVAGVRESFVDDGVDEQVLQELKQIWESKLQSSKAVEQNTESTVQQAMGSVIRNQNVKLGDHGNQTTFPEDQSRSEKVYPVQITLPAQQDSGESAPRVLTIQVPESAIAGNQLQTILTGPVIGATLALPNALATSLLQQHVTAALQGHQTGNLLATRQYNVQNSGTASQVDGACDADLVDIPESSLKPPKFSVKRTGLFSFTCKKKSSRSNKPSSSSQSKSICVQVDGGIDTSDEDDDDDDDDDVEDEDEDKDEEPEYLEGAVEEEPLNSGDDVSEEDVSDLFDTDNVVVCQYDKITRSRNKWKFYLKDGIMNLSGKDYVFQRSNGDAEW